MDYCKKLLNATIVLSSSGGNYTTLVAFGDIVNAITEADNVTTEALLSSRPFSLAYDINVIVSVKRP